MEFSYGEGNYKQGHTDVDGRIILAEHKLYIKGKEGDYSQTFIPLEKIVNVKKWSGGVLISVRISMAQQFMAHIKGNNKHINELIKDLVNRRGLKKKLLKNEWYEQSS